MCEFISWIEKPNGEVLFLTADMVYKNPRGTELRKFTKDPDDLVGHGAISYYFGCERNEGIHKECTDFTSPKNFPDVIVKAIKEGKMIYPLVAFPEGLLSRSIYETYDLTYSGICYKYTKNRNYIREDYDKQEYDIIKKFKEEEEYQFSQYHKSQLRSVKINNNISIYTSRVLTDITNREFEELTRLTNKKYCTNLDDISNKQRKKLKELKLAHEKVIRGMNLHMWKMFEDVENRQPAWR